MRFIIFIIISLLFLPLVQADSTFFDQDDAFIMGDSTTTSPTGGVIEGTTGGTTGSGGCSYKWNCTDWSECLPSGKQTRICTNIGTCSDTYKSPEIKQNCTYNASEIGEEDEKSPLSPPEEKIVDKNKTFIYFIIVLIILSIILYLKKDYFKKLIKNKS